MVSRFPILLFFLCAILAGDAIASRYSLRPPQPKASKSAWFLDSDAPVLKRQRRKKKRKSPSSQAQTLRKVGESQRQRVARIKIQRQASSVEAKPIIDQMLPILTATKGDWKWRYYDIAYKLQFTLRKTHHFNESVIALLQKRGIEVPPHHLITKQRNPPQGTKYILENTPPKEVKEVMAEVWVQQELHKSSIKRKLFLGEDWERGQTYKHYLGSNLPDIDNLTPENIMNLPVWTRYRLVENRIEQLKKMDHKWTQEKVAQALGYEGPQRAVSRWISVDLLKQPEKMITLLKRQEHFISPPPQTAPSPVGSITPRVTPPLRSPRSIRAQARAKQKAKQRLKQPAKRTAPAQSAEAIRAAKIAEAAAAKPVIDEIVPQLVAPTGEWKLRYYDITNKLEFPIGKHHFNPEVIKRLNERGIEVPQYKTHVSKTGRHKGIKYRLTRPPSPEAKEVMAEVWVQHELHKNVKKRALFLGKDWNQNGTYKHYLGSNLPDIDNLTSENIMNLPLWTRYRLVENRVGGLTSRYQQGPHWTRTNIAVELGYDKTINAGARWLSVDLLGLPKEMIRLLKSKTHFISPPKATSFKKATAVAAAAKPRRRGRLRKNTTAATTKPRRKGSARQRTNFTTVRPSRRQQDLSRQARPPIVKTVFSTPTPPPSPQAAASSVGSAPSSAMPPATAAVTPSPKRTGAPPVTPPITEPLAPLTAIPSTPHSPASPGVPEIDFDGWIRAL